MLYYSAQTERSTRITDKGAGTAGLDPVVMCWVYELSHWQMPHRSVIALYGSLN